MVRRFALCTVLLTGCVAMTPEQQEQFQAGIAALAAAQQPSAPQAKFMVFGGPDHRTYLGCLNCSEYAADSVLNSYGTYGSSYSMTSVYNSYGEYGSQYSMYSACSPYASDPPVIVDQAGNFYGRLTVNAFNTERVRDPTVIQWLEKTCAH